MNDMVTKERSKRSRGTGLVLLVVSVTAFVLYAYFLLATQWSIIILQLTVLVAVAALVAVLAWIGYTIATARRRDDSNFKQP